MSNHTKFNGLDKLDVGKIFVLAEEFENKRLCRFIYYVHSKQIILRESKDIL